MMGVVAYAADYSYLLHLIWQMKIHKHKDILVFFYTLAFVVLLLLPLAFILLHCTVLDCMLSVPAWMANKLHHKHLKNDCGIHKVQQQKEIPGSEFQ